MCGSWVASIHFFPFLYCLLHEMSHIAHSVHTVNISTKINSWYRTHISLSLGQSNMFDIKAILNECFKLWKVHSWTGTLQILWISSWCFENLKLIFYVMLHNSFCLQVLFAYSMYFDCSLNAQVYSLQVYTHFWKK